MADSRKAKLSTEVDSSGAKQGFDEIKQGARDMAREVTQAGQQAADGVAKFGAGAKGAGDSWTREEGRIRAAMQRSTLELQTLGKTLSQKFEAKIDFKGLDPAKFQADLAALREAEAVSARLAQAQKGESFLGDLRGQIAALRERVQLESMSADEALRYKAAQAGVGAAAAPLILQLQNMRAAQEAVAQAAREEAAAQKEAAAAAARRTSFIDDLRQQAEAIGKTRSQLLEMQAAQLGLADKAAPYIAKIREAEQGSQKLGATNKLAAFQTQQLGFQLHDFAVQVASGQNPLTAFVQQGSQLSGTFGGAGNAMRAVLGLLTPFRAGMLAAAAGIGVFVAELVHAESGLRNLNDLQAQLAGTGRGGQFGESFLRDYIRDLSTAPGITREVASQIVSELAKAHDIGGALFTDLGKLAVDYAKVTRTEVPAAARVLAKAFSDPAQGAKTLEEALGTLSSAQTIAIERLTRQGDIAGAQKVLFDAMSSSIKGLADEAMTPLQRATNDLGNAWDRAMDRMDQSQGLRSVNALLATSIGLVKDLIANADKIGGLGNLGASLVPGALPGRAGAAVGSLIRSAISSSSGGQFEGNGATGSFGGPAGPGGPAAGPAPSDTEVKRALEAANAYQSVSGKIAELTEKREGFNKALTQSIALYGRDSEQTKRLRDAIAGINEQITNIGKRAGQEGNQTRQATLQADLQAFKDRLQDERDALVFHQQYLQGVFNAGEISFRDFYDRRRDAIREGVDAELQELERRKDRLQQELTGEKDPSSRKKLEGQIADVGREQEKATLKGSRDVVLANQQQVEAYRQLSDEVANYRAELLQLQGDEAAAARIRAGLAIEQARRLAAKSQGTAAAISPQEQRANEDAIRQQVALTEAKRQTGIVNQALALEEGRIADAQRRGSITSTEALAQVGDARRRVVAQLEEIVKAQEEVAASRPQDYQLQIDTAAARQQLERLKEELDPLAESFRSLFTNATGDLFADLADDPKNAKESVKRWLTSITREINAQLGKDLASALFGKDGPLGDLPGALGNRFRKGARQGSEKPLVDTDGVTQGLVAFQATGLEPATAALTRFTLALQGAAGVASGQQPGAKPELTTGDFARMDRLEVKTEDAQISADQLARSNATAADAALNLASAASRGGSALSLLPSIIAFIKAAAAGESAGGGIGGLLSSLFSSGSAVNMGTATGADLALFYAKGGYTGDTDPKQAAGIVHGKEFVFDAEATAKIGRATLERIHKAAHGDPETMAAALIARVRGKREFGGDVEAGGMYEVNERRPEVLTMGNKDYLMMGAQRGRVEPKQTGDIHIVNNTQGRVDRVERRTTPEGDQVLVLEQAMVGWLQDPNSRVSRTLGRSTTATRRR